jgi:pyruvate,orthophosphate dikinase
MVYPFNDSVVTLNSGARNLLGGKGSWLAEMSSLGIPVPPGFTITTEVCNAFYSLGCQFPEGLAALVASNLQLVEERVGSSERGGRDARTTRAPGEHAARGDARGPRAG